MIRIIKERFISNAGNPIHRLYKPIVDKNGFIDLKEDGFENTDEIIQSHAESCDIQIILNKAQYGDLSGLNAVKGIFGDFTEMPKSYAEFLQLKIDSTIMFNKLPADVRAKFDNDPNQFFAQSGQEEWFQKLGIVEEKTEMKGDNTALDNNEPKAE